MACEILVIPVSMVASKSAFSIGRRVLDLYCNSLTLRMVEVLVCTGDWLKEYVFLALDGDDSEVLQQLRRRQLYLLKPSLGVVHPSSSLPFIAPSLHCIHLLHRCVSEDRNSSHSRSKPFALKIATLAVLLVVLLAVLVAVLLASLCRSSACFSVVVLLASLSRFCSLLCRSSARFSVAVLLTVLLEGLKCPAPIANGVAELPVSSVKHLKDFLCCLLSQLQNKKNELQSHVEAGENHEDAFVAVLGKDQLGRVRCYGTSVTRSSLRKDEEICQVKVEYNDKVSSLEKKMDGVCGLLNVMLHQLNPEMSDEEVAALVQATQNSLLDASSSRPRNTPHSSRATVIPPTDDGNDKNNGAHNG
ncbi:uncharacterized protein LOC127748457 [Arachis duranensis]|uniref:Uncharacterized protein LOC127748457 n=1 Tax=Arachis duranensis TaxID=130453 RepID=A0A9C6WUX1_ARADU|nr:uncharacterized protein LOC127748457 [Arachis duranensis]